MRASFARRMLQYVPLPPATAFMASATGVSTTATLVGTAIGGVAPSWASTPSISVTATVAGGPVLFSFTGGTPTSVVVEPGDTLPAWITLTLTGMSWSAAAPAGAAFSFRLRASNVNGYGTSGAISGTVAAAPASTGFFAGYTVAKRPLTTAIGNNDNGIVADTKQTVWSEHPSGRIWGPFGGDYPSNFNMWQWSLNPTTWADGATNQPTGWRLEQADPVGLGYPYLYRTDCQQVAWDSKRQIFWHVGGYNENAQTDAYAFRKEVCKFDPAQPINQRWSTTGVPYPTDAYGRQASEKGGAAFYDPILDCVFAHWGWGAAGNVAIWNCATQAWMGFLWFPDTVNLNDDAYLTQVVGIDPHKRLLYLKTERSISADFSSPITQQFRGLYKVALPSSTASLPAAGMFGNYSASCTKVWDNAGRTTTLIAVGGATHVRRDGRNYYYTWTRGPYSTVFDSGEPATKYGRCGHPAKGNGVYGSANTGILVDLDTGAEEATQLPHLTYDDGQGWIIPNITLWSETYSAFLYMTMDTEAGTGLSNRRENNCVIVRKPLPSWVSSLALNQWYQLPNSTPETTIPTSIRNAWSAAEPVGAGVELDANKNPWWWSDMALRRKDSVLMFHGGGGGDGRGNGVLGFALNAEVGASGYGWKLPMKPTALSKILPTVTELGGVTPTYARNSAFNYTHVNTNTATLSSPPSPAALHAYGCCTFFNTDDTWYRFGSQQVYPQDVAPGDSERGIVFGFRYKDAGSTEADWIISGITPGARSSVPVSSGETMDYRTVVKDPWTDDFIIGAAGRWHHYDAAKNAWTANVQEVGVTSGKWGVGFEPRQRVAILTDFNGGIPVGLDFSAGHPRTVRVGNASSWGGPNGAEYAGSGTNSPGMWAWDDDNNCFWVVKAKLTDSTYTTWDLFKIVLTNKTTMQFSVTKVSTTGDKPSFTNVTAANYLSAQYVPELGVLAVSTSYRNPIFAIRVANKV